MLHQKIVIDFAVKFYNADGGQANMCLNGLDVPHHIFGIMSLLQKNTNIQTKKIDM